MFTYRVTKYDPIDRDGNGRYRGDEWTSYAQVGRAIGGRILTIQEYWTVEDAYVIAAVDVLREAGIYTLAICGLENAAGYRPETFPLREGGELSGNDLQQALRCMLREYFLCRLEGDARTFIHTGWDYTLYIGVPCLVCESIRAARAAGLYVTSYESPYNPVTRDAQPN